MQIHELSTVSVGVLVGNLKVTDGPALIERVLGPARVAAILKTATDDEIVSYFNLSRSVGQRAWMAMAVCIGEAQSRAGRGDGVLDDLAKTFGLHRSRIARLGRIHRELIAPRIEQQGEGVVFELPEQAWYEIATEAAPVVSKTPMQLLEDAEQRKAGDSSYSTRRWKLDIGVTDSGTMTKDLRGLLMKLAAIEDDVVREYVREPVDRLSLRTILDRIERILKTADRTGAQECEAA